jgi:dihydrofolate reductase
MTEPVRPRLTMIVARARDGAIGRANALPWRLPEDLRHFKAATLGHPVLMGRRTFESIGRPLPGRTNVVLTRDPAWSHAGCERAGSLDEALSRCRGAAEVFVIGGARLYAEALPRADRLLVTEVDLDVPDADAHFPDVEPDGWRIVRGEPAVGAGGIGYRIDEWRRSVDARGNPGSEA